MLARRHVITLILCTLTLVSLVRLGSSVTSGSRSRTDATADRRGARGMRTPNPNARRLVSLVNLGGTNLVASSLSTKASPVFEQPSTTQEPRQQNVRELNQGQVIEREIANGQAHSYRVRLLASQYLNVVVE